MAVTNCVYLFNYSKYLDYSTRQLSQKGQTSLAQSPVKTAHFLQIVFPPQGSLKYCCQLFSTLADVLFTFFSHQAFWHFHKQILLDENSE